MKAAFLAEVGLVSLLLGLALLEPALAWPYALVALGLGLLSLCPWNMGRLLSGAWVLGLVFAMAQLRLDPASGVRAWWPLVPSGTLLLAGLGLSFQEINQTRQRMDMVWAVVVAVLATGLSVGAASWLLSARSTSGMRPGSLDFVGSMVVWATCWFGLDAWARFTGQPGKPGALHWLLRKRGALYVVGLAVLSVIRGLLA